jgi:hypothetical protein
MRPLRLTGLLGARDWAHDGVNHYEWVVLMEATSPPPAGPGAVVTLAEAARAYEGTTLATKVLNLASHARTHGL